LFYPRSCGRATGGERFVKPARRLAGLLPPCRREDTDLDINAGGKAQSLLQRLDGLARRLDDIDQALVGPDFALLTRLSIDVRTAQNRVAFDASRQRNRAVHDRTRSLGRVYNLMGRAIEYLMVIGLHSDANPLACKTRQITPSSRRSWAYAKVEKAMLVTGCGHVKTGTGNAAG